MSAPGAPRALARGPRDPGARNGGGEERRGEGGREGCHDLPGGRGSGETLRPSARLGKTESSESALIPRPRPLHFAGPRASLRGGVGGGNEEHPLPHTHPPQERARERLGSDASALSPETREGKETGVLPREAEAAGTRGPHEGSRSGSRAWSPHASPRAAQGTGPAARLPQPDPGHPGFGEIVAAAEASGLGARITGRAPVGAKVVGQEEVGIGRRSWRRSHRCPGTVPHSRAGPKESSRHPPTPPPSPFPPNRAPVSAARGGILLTSRLHKPPPLLGV